MIFSWIKRNRRAKLLAEPYPQEWIEILERNVPYYPLLDAVEQTRLRNDARIMIAEKNWEGIGIELTDEMKVTIAGQACLLVLGIEHDYFANVLSILVYPKTFSVERPLGNLGGDSYVPLVGKQFLDGQASHRDHVALSWKKVLFDSRHPGHGSNLVWHEFAHQLDMLNHEIDGTPPLEDRPQRIRWMEVMNEEFDRLRQARRAGEQTLIDPYAATNEAEFFAVVTEHFFDEPIELEQHHAELYGLLRDYYRQDPAARLRRSSKHEVQRTKDEARENHDGTA